ncbi:hypothetical protein [Wolbachia endosymbiont of Litomosoides sigmodontis]|uniref:hypothetical protein n=1 Tax=Wolbachia endosymbiont of Litomosoides sigmodontis TaxID=80850 RepID=UPI001FE88359|nr:hypothetical protein [Wolbachia endosymbiont of Litomosoides sigmodontis]
MLFCTISARLLSIAYRKNELFNLLVIFGILIQFITQFVINICGNIEHFSNHWHNLTAT